jgi:beta-glucosidase
MLPFGFGLSYNEYHYGGISYDNLDNDVIVIPITNKGLLKGEEIVQLYAQTRYSQHLQPIIRLIDFQRVSLKPGETKWVRFDVKESKEHYQLYSSHPDQVVWAIGSSSRDLKNKTPVR